MIKRITLPKLDANITEATVADWHKAEGEFVRKGDVLVDLITDKANFEMTSETEGTLRKVLVGAKSQVPVGFILALIGEPEDELPDVSDENAKVMREYLASVAGKSLSTNQAGGTATPSVEGPARAERLRATPRARRLAREHSVDLEKVRSRTGVEIVTEKEVQDYLREKGQ
jgi:pyruvate/2-oxoglutarate dehydrogenase complex dihydrolipoamide acyltransferase (E2) component